MNDEVGKITSQRRMEAVVSYCVGEAAQDKAETKIRGIASRFFTKFTNHHAASSEASFLVFHAAVLKCHKPPRKLHQTRRATRNTQVRVERRLESSQSFPAVKEGASAC